VGDCKAVDDLSRGGRVDVQLRMRGNGGEHEEKGLFVVLCTRTG